MLAALVFKFLHCSGHEDPDLRVDWRENQAVHTALMRVGDVFSGR